MKIAVCHNLGSGGAKRALYGHVKALKEHGFYLEAWTSDISSPDYLPLSELITENKKPLKENYEKAVKIRNPLRRELKLLGLLDNHYRNCVREIESGHFDILFVASCTVTYMPYIGEFIQIPRILYLGEPYRLLHEAFPENIWQAPYRKFRLKKIKRIYYDLLLNYSRRIKLRREIDAAKSYNKILVNSLFSRENVIRAYGVDATVCYLGIDTQKFRAEVTKKESYVVSLGTIGHIKGVHRAIEIIGAMPREIRPGLKWIANGAEKYYMEEMIQFAGQKEVDLEFHLNITDKELISIVSKAAVMLYTPVLEPFGLAVLEANACGTYVVAIAEGGVRESITDGLNGLLIKGYRIEEFADALSLFIQDPDYALTKGVEAAEFVRKNWNEKLMAKNILSEFEKISLAK